MTIDEIEAACDQSLALDFTRHSIEAPELTLCGLYYPLGFPTEVRTNSPDILKMYCKAWGTFDRRFDIDPIRIDVHVIGNESESCPPTPTYRIMRPLMISAADADHYSVADVSRCRTQIVVSKNAEKYEQYLRYFFLDSAPLFQIATRYATPLHAGCVSLDSRGILLCGDSGAGKSTLAYACARAGWTFVTDDAGYLVLGDDARVVTGNCQLIRFRPQTIQLFEELHGQQITPRAEGKPSIEIPTASLRHLKCAQTTEADFMVFLNRRTAGPPQLVPYRKDVARQFMRQTLFGSGEMLELQYEAIEKLLKIDVLELRYSDLNWAVERLTSLVQAGC